MCYQYTPRRQERECSYLTQNVYGAERGNEVFITYYYTPGTADTWDQPGDPAEFELKEVEIYRGMRHKKLDLNKMSEHLKDYLLEVAVKDVEDHPYER